jgi:hypothetical protein
MPHEVSWPINVFKTLDVDQLKRDLYFCWRGAWCGWLGMAIHTVCNGETVYCKWNASQRPGQTGPVACSCHIHGVPYSTIIS